MRAEAPHFPGYDFEFNKGYPCPRHKAALQWLGPSAIHRRSWVFMDHLSWTGIPRTIPPSMQGELFTGDGLAPTTPTSPAREAAQAPAGAAPMARSFGGSRTC
jgi:hypothetical protein